MNFFIGVNYDSSSCIKDWVLSINKCSQQSEIFIVDNFSSEAERQECLALSKEINFKLLTCDNIGYGRALNYAFSYIKCNYNISDESVFFAGNIDIIYSSIPQKLPNGNFVYIPKTMEGNRNRNPFLTKLQSKVLPLYKVVVKTENGFLLKIIILINKIIGFFPSQPWAIHGSLFSFNGALLSDNTEIFNENTFLYCEEIEFASYCEEKKIDFVSSDIIYQHIAHVSTGKIITDLSSFIKVWKPAFINWNKRFR